MIFEAAEEVAKLALVVAGLYYALGAYVSRQRPAWSEPLAKRRVVVLALLILAVCTVKISEDVFQAESGPIDRAILLLVHRHVPGALFGLFKAVTFTGSSAFLFPLTAATSGVLFWANRRFEALVVATSVIGAAIVIYLVKMLVGRDRPALWDTQAYWGSSFPSGHTVGVAAFSLALAVCISRIRPQARVLAFSAAIVWIVLVGSSRLVLGVHWPSDVLAAACIGAFLPLALSVALELYLQRH